MKEALPANHPTHPMPFVRVELVLLSVKEAKLNVLLSHRQEAPFKDKWGLPGGVLRIDLDESLEQAAQRVATERLGRELNNLNQVTAVGGAKRDPRAPWAMSVIYRSLVESTLKVEPGKRVKALKWISVEEVSKSRKIAFDHAELIELAVSGLRQEIRELRFPEGSTPSSFTLPELQAHCEAILGESIDKVTFRRRINATNLLIEVEGEMRSGAHRPAQVYTFAR